MNEKPSPFAAIFAEIDNLGLLATRAPSVTRSTEEELTLSQFEAINAFIDAHGIAPGNTEDGREPELSEYALEGHLDTFRHGEAYYNLLKPYDRHGLLGGAPMDLPETMVEILASNDPLLEAEAGNIFKLTHVNPPAEKTAPDEIAKRRPCVDFELYRPIFETLRSDLMSANRVTKRFEREGSIAPGTAFILNGIMAYVAEVETPQRRGKEIDARLRVIFDNGMESNHLLRSFARVLYEDENGRQIIETTPATTGPLFTGVPELGENELHTGTIYIVESLSSEPSIAALRGRLYKIGFTTQPVEQRLATVETDPTFLLAPVKIVTVFETVNLNPRKLEQLIHQFFGQARLQVDVLLGRSVTPKEWFVVPLELVREAIARILDESILNYRYDHLSRKIVPR